ncbi:MAG: MFS transporter [Chloroflexi bacterium]|nr:MFS transporter [Chloroflexota bacterium]
MIDTLGGNRRIALHLILSTVLLYVGFGVWQTSFNNFAVEELGVGPDGIGWVQALRELPGLIGFVLGFMVLYMSEIRIASVSVIAMGAGMILTGQSYGLPMLIVSTLLLSTGFHFFYPCNNAVLLMAVKKGGTPKAMGLLRSLSSFATVLATIIVFLLATRVGFRPMFTAMGILVVVGGLALLPMDKGTCGLPTRRKVIIRRQYWVYYALSFLMGSRRHFSQTFAIFLLVSNYGMSVQTTSLLYLFNNVLNTYVYGLMGKVVQRFGERRVLSIGFVVIIFIFIGYAFIDSLPVLAALYVLDNLTFGITLAIPTYFQKIAVTPEEITSNLSVEQTTNHIAAVIVPVLGGTLWVTLGREVPFLAGAVITLITLGVAQFMRITPAQEAGAAPSVGAQPPGPPWGLHAALAAACSVRPSPHPEAFTAVQGGATGRTRCLWGWPPKAVSPLPGLVV